VLLIEALHNELGIAVEAVVALVRVVAEVLQKFPERAEALHALFALEIFQGAAGSKPRHQLSVHRPSRPSLSE
jgi:hypothetical protein